AGPTHGGSEFLEEIIGELFGRAVNEPLTELSKLAANLRLDCVTEQRSTVIRLEFHRCAAGSKASDTAVTLAAYLVSIWRIKIGQRHLAFEARFDGTDFGHRDRLEFRVR